jgi:hypothetical protein
MLVMDQVTALLVRLMRSRRRPSVDQANPESAFETSPIAVKQREVQFSDFEGVAALKQRWGLRRDTWENWCRLWAQNPAMAAATSPLSMGWVLETERGIVGYQGSIPLLYQIGDRTLVAATGTDLVVEPRYRVRTVGLLASFYRQPGVELRLITTAIPSVGEISKALRAQELPQRDYDTILFWVLNTSEFARVVATKLGLEGAMATAGTVLGSLALRTDMSIRRLRPSRVNAELRITEIRVEDIGDEFEALWQRKITEKPRLMAVRNASCLRWHFTLPGSASGTAVLCCRRFERLTGYAVVRHVMDGRTGIRKCVLADILAEQDDPSIIASLLEGAHAHAVRSGDHVFEVTGLPRNIRQIFMSRNPYLWPYPAPPFLYRVMDEALAETLANENAWYAGPFDGDTTLVP